MALRNTEILYQITKSFHPIKLLFSGAKTHVFMQIANPTVFCFHSDNRSMAAIAGLQQAQYGRVYKTGDGVRTDYVALAQAVMGVKGIFGGFSPESFRKALADAYGYQGLSLIHLPVYAGTHELGDLGAFGRWNVGNWCEEVQKEHHRIGL